MKIHSGHWHWHPTVRTDGDLTRGERVADAVVKFMGSWGFIIGMTAVIACWIFINLIVLALRFDPFPFILLNLAFSTLAAYAAPLILIGQRRDDQKASERGEHDLQVDLETLDIVRRIERKLGER